MKSIEFGGYIKQIREKKSIPQRIVAHRLDVDTSTLSKMELGERQITISMIKGLSEVLEIDYKELQVKYISEKFISDFKDQPFLPETLENIKKILNESKST